ncbi:CCR4-Not complex component, Not1-domain-containing protein [Powellomyces hirtus]|nr:CCR4-Not complex component, Not1-domain-containing protein [Powellomyces hirtus]
MSSTDSSIAGQISAGVKVAQLMRELGYSTTSSPDTLRRVFQHVKLSEATMNEKVVADMLCMMIRTHSGLEQSVKDKDIAMDIFNVSDVADIPRATSWNVEVAIQAALDLKLDLDWFSVLRQCDQADFLVVDAPALAVLLNASKVVLKDPYQFPIGAFFGRWKNELGQLSFLRQAIQSIPEIFSMNQTISKRVVPLDVAASARSAIPSLATQSFNCLELIEALVGLSDGPLYGEVKPILDFAVQQSPELMLLGFAQMTAPWNDAMKELTPGLVMLFLTGHPNSTFVLPRLWQLNQNLSISGLLHLYTKDPSSLSRILDVAQEMRALSQILETKPLSFSIDLAALASRRDYLNLEKWLQDHLREQGDVFVVACLEFLNEKMANQNARSEVSNNKRSVPLSLDVVAIFLRVLHAHTPMSPTSADFLKDISSSCLQTYPRLVNIPTLGEGVSGDGTTFTDDVEEEANSYYERIYKSELTINQVMDLLQRFKTSANPREQDTYKCMVHNLFDEYKFFPRYPEKELAITSVLFGAMIQNQIVTSRALGMALRYVLDALRQPVGSRLFKFGIQALSQFQARLGEWPQYCSLLLQIGHLYQAHPEIVQYIKTLQTQASGPGVDAPTEQLSAEASLVLNSKEIMQNPEGMSRVTEAPVFTALRLDTLLDAASRDQFEVPNEATQDKILFIINNVSIANLEIKVAEMKTILKEQHYRWFSHYIVVKRASIEPNFHSLYIAFLDALESPGLHRHILHETYSNIRILLNSEKTVTSSQERSLLKNLGTWLGGITLGKNKPIKHKNLGVKDLLLEGYDSSRLIVVIPFVCKVLEQGSKHPKSRVFKPPNPWLMAIMKLLAELYHFADLKLNLKFEIEVLCKNLKLAIKDIQPTTLLRNRPQKQSATEGSANAFANAKPTSSSPLSAVPPTSGAPPGALSGGLAPGFGAESTGGVLSQHSISQVDESGVGIPNLAAFITFNPNLPIFSAQPSLKRIVHIAIDRAIREIISPVVERSVTIAGIATRELVVKDFALEPDESRMRKAAHLMVSSLAGSLASVSSREPLRVSMMSHLRSLLVQNGFTEQTMPEQAVYIIVADNLDLACSVLEKAAAEKALPDIDEALSSSFVNRRKHRERSSQPFYDMAVYAASRYPSTLPDPLRLKIGGLNGQQLRVYEDFSRVAQNATPRIDQVDKIPRNGSSRMDMRTETASAILAASGRSPAEDGTVSISVQQALEKFAHQISELEKHITQVPLDTLDTLPDQHPIRDLLREISVTMVQPFNRDEMALLFAQKVVNLLYTCDSVLARESCVVLLRKLCEVSKRLNKEIKEWLLYHDDERKYNVPATVAVVQANFITVPELDMQLARLMDTGRVSVLEYTIHLIQKFGVISDPTTAVQSEFFNSLEMLNKLAVRGKIPEPLNQALTKLKSHMPLFSVKDLTTKDTETATLREHLAALFHDWVRTFYHPASNEKSHAAFIQQLQQQGILRAEAISPLFFRVCTEICMDAYTKERAAPGLLPSLPFQAVDAFARLIVLLVRYHVDPAGIDDNHAKLNLTAKILSIIVLVLVHSHEQQRGQFNQRPFFRLFSTLLNDLSMYEWDLQPIYIQILSAMSNTFHTLQPSFLPGFTFSWLQLVSHRFFMPKLLLSENQKFWPFFQRLLVDLFKFLGPFLRQAEMTETTRLLYRATLRILLVLLHDFPEFLCDYHFSFVDVIPHTCIQLRNLILSAFPRNMRLPDPFTPNLKVDLLPEINQPPHVLSDYTSNLVPNNLKHDIDVYLKSRSPVSFLLDLKSRLLATPAQAAAAAALATEASAARFPASTQYNVPAVNALVLYVGVQAITQTQSKASLGVAASPVTHSAPMDIFQQLALDLDIEGRYLLFSAIANQLRYPNSHTHYFSCVLLYLFAEANQEVIQEQITRVLIERLVVNRPHPYGLLITFIELIRNPRYNFWDHNNFIRCAPEIERLFGSVAKSINQSLMRSPQ